MLDGLRVVEYTQVLAGPFAGAILSDLGAEVIKIERPDGGDSGRNAGRAFHNGDALSFHEINRGKKSVTIDFNSPEDCSKFSALIETADIFFHNQRPDVAVKFGFDGKTLCDANPRLIHCGISGFGHKGPKASAPGYEAAIQAYSGLSSINGFPDKPPVRLGVSVVDLGTGMWTVLGILVALHQRSLTGRGTVINTSLLETALTWASLPITGYLNTGREGKRMGTALGNMVPYQTFDAEDDAIVIAAGNDRLFAKFAAVVGRPEWASDPRYSTNRARIENRDELIAKINEVTRTQKRAYWQEKFENAGIPSSPVNSIAQASAEPQVLALDIIRELPDISMKLLGLPLSFDGVRPEPVGRGPALGEHNTWLVDELAAGPSHTGSDRSRPQDRSGLQVE